MESGCKNAVWKIASANSASSLSAKSQMQTTVPSCCLKNQKLRQRYSVSVCKITNEDNDALSLSEKSEKQTVMFSRCLKKSKSQTAVLRHCLKNRKRRE